MHCACKLVHIGDITSAQLDGLDAIEGQLRCKSSEDIRLQTVENNRVFMSCNPYADMMSDLLELSSKKRYL